MTGEQHDRIQLGHCRRCGTDYFYPRGHCPECGSIEVDTVSAGARGTIYSYTVDRRPSGEFAGLPYVITAYVRLNERPAVLAHVVGCEPEQVFIGMSVIVDTTSERPGGVAQFRPDPAAPAGGAQ